MDLIPREYISGDYEKYIQSLTKENMQKYFLENFGGWSDEVSEKKLLDLVKTGFVQLFFIEDRFIGYISYGKERDNHQSYLIHDLHIVKEFQGQGFGTKILDLTINKVLKLNCNQLKVFVFKNNPSLNFYIKKGFKETDFLEKSNTCILVRNC